MSVREELEKLGRLQELDLKIDRARKIVSSAPRAYAQLESELAAEVAKLNALENEKSEIEKQKRGLETDIVMDRDRIKNIEGRLSGVTNNKEFHAASKEAEKAKKSISDREKLVGEQTEKISGHETLVAEIKNKIEEIKKAIEEKKKEVGDQVGEADKEIASYAGDRDSIVAGIQKPLMSRYNRIRTVYSDAIVPVKSGHCTSCNVSLPPQMYIQVQKGLEVLTCPSCQRLLYFAGQ